MIFSHIRSLIILLSCLTTSIASAQNQFIGTFTNLFTGLTITVNKDYTGTYSVLDQNYPIKASLINDNQLTGSYTYENREITFDILFDGNRYKIKTEGLTLKLIYTPTGEASASSSESPATKVPEGQKLTISLNSSPKSFPALGYQFRAPSRWTYQLLDEHIHVYKSGDQMSSIIVLPHDYNDKNEVKLAAQSEGIQEDGMMLFALSQIQDYGANGILGTFSGWIDGVGSKAAVISLFSPYGGGVTMMAYTNKNSLTLRMLTL